VGGGEIGPGWQLVHAAGARLPPDDHTCFVDTRTPQSRDYESTTTSRPENVGTRPREELGMVATSFAMRACMGAGMPDRQLTELNRSNGPLWHWTNQCHYTRRHSSMSQQRMIRTGHYRTYIQQTDEGTIHVQGVVSNLFNILHVAKINHKYHFVCHCVAIW
jgi:hypothetical protein